EVGPAPRPRPLPRREALLDLHLDEGPQAAPTRRDSRPHDGPESRRLGDGGTVQEVLPVAVVVVGDDAASLGVPVLGETVGVGLVGDAATGVDYPVPLPARLDVVALLDVLELDLARRLVAHWFLLWMV